MLILETQKSNTIFLKTFQIEIRKHRVLLTILLRDIICMHNSLQLIQLQSPSDRKNIYTKLYGKLVPSPPLVDKITSGKLPTFHMFNPIKR